MLLVEDAKMILVLLVLMIRKVTVITCDPSLSYCYATRSLRTITWNTSFDLGNHPISVIIPTPAFIDGKK